MGDSTPRSIRPISVLLVDDHPSIREGVRPGLERDGLAEVVAEASDGLQAVAAAKEVKPDVVLMDLNLPTMNGIEATRQIVAELPNTKVLVFSSSGDEPDVLEAIKAGASGYLLKTSRAHEVAEAVNLVFHGQLHFTPSLAGMVLEEFRRQTSSKEVPKDQHLSPIEKQALEMSEKGAGIPDIAAKLKMSPTKVLGLLNAALEKMRTADLP